MTPAKRRGREPWRGSVDQATHLATIRPLAARWHGTPEGRATHTRAARRYQGDHAQHEQYECGPCPGCGYPFLSPHQNTVYCSQRCAHQVAMSDGRYMHAEPCPVCGTLFQQNNYPLNGKRKPGTCSRKCGQQQRRRS